MHNEERNHPWYVYVLAIAIGLAVTFSDKLVQFNLVLPIVCAIFLFAFALLLWRGIKEWKKSDEEILSAYHFFQLSAPENQKSGNLTAIQWIFGLVAIIVIAFLRLGGISLPVIGVIGIMAASVYLSPIVAKRLKKRSAQKASHKTDPWITGREIAAFLVGLFPSAFMCFFIGIGFYHGVWWFTLLPGLIFLFSFSRPLVAAVRTVIRRARSDDEKHVHKGKEADPWDRPDTDPDKYRRK